MAVIGANRMLGLRRRTAGVDAHGTAVAGVLGEVGEWKPGRIVTRPEVDGDGESGPGLWVLAVDASWWPFAAADQVVEQGASRAWTVMKAKPLRSDFDPAVDYVRVEASLAVQA
ncbi:hypothetical protein [Nonomuraea sp. JJY05]|uniref:hypothetical protein n=1 Tax=Nonomuraea sp. JJY05 TaxID=3350255 RepID=UPI00373E1BD1